MVPFLKNIVINMHNCIAPCNHILFKDIFKNTAIILVIFYNTNKYFNI